MFPSIEHTLFFSDGKWCVLEYLTREGKAELTAAPMSWVDWQSFILHWPVDEIRAIKHKQAFSSKENVWHAFPLTHNLLFIIEVLL